MTVNEVVALVRMVRERAPLAICEAGNADGNRQITIDEGLATVNRALNGCAD